MHSRHLGGDALNLGFILAPIQIYGNVTHCHATGCRTLIKGIPSCPARQTQPLSKSLFVVPLTSVKMDGTLLIGRFPAKARQQVAEKTIPVRISLPGILKQLL